VLSRDLSKVAIIDNSPQVRAARPGAGRRDERRCAPGAAERPLTRVALPPPPRRHSLTSSRMASPSSLGSETPPTSERPPHTISPHPRKRGARACAARGE